MSASIAAHELIYTRDAHGARGCLHHLAFWVDTREECLRAADIWLDPGIEIEAAPSKHAIAQGFFLYRIEPGGNRIEVTTGGRFVYAPDEPFVVWTKAERAKGQAWGVQTVASFHTYGTPPIRSPARRLSRRRRNPARPGAPRGAEPHYPLH
jgi:catechol 2,3-dioxygenase